jgi:hypothetical protein
MRMREERKDVSTDEPAELEPVEDAVEETAAPIVAPMSIEFAAWRDCYLGDRLPSLFLDANLRIIKANESFCRLFGCETQMPGQYFTQFYTPFFDEKKSADLFRSARNAATGFMWHGRVERIGADQRLNVAKVWIMPLVPPTDGTMPDAYSAVCLDMTAEHRQLLHSTFSSLLEAARLKDNDTGNHIERVNRYARVMAEDLAAIPVAGVDREFVESIGLVAALHDVGKIGTPDDILNKAGPLESWEWKVMQQHTTNGAYILSTYPNPLAREIALRHHERWDGTGYPHGLSGDLIPLPARIVAVADVYDALRMRRTYKEPYTHEQALKNMSDEAGTHFDAFLIQRFLGIAESFRTIFSELADPQ